MKKHQCPAPSETVQRFKFNTRMHQPNESVSTYVAELRSLIEFCGYQAGRLDGLLIKLMKIFGLNVIPILQLFHKGQDSACSRQDKCPFCTRNC